MILQVLILSFAVLVLSQPNPTRYTLHDVTFADGTQATGSFTYDGTSGSNVDVTTYEEGNFPMVHYSLVTFRTSTFGYFYVLASNGLLATYVSFTLSDDGSGKWTVTMGRECNSGYGCREIQSGYFQAGDLCGDGIITGTEQCDGGDCCDATTCNFLTTVCRPSSGACDIAETCTGTSATCPDDSFVSSSTVCRPSSGVCDVAESCSGSSADCPADSFAPASTVCRQVNGSCDVAETCSGSSSACPADKFASSSTVCRPANGSCDIAEKCTGTSTSCPADQVSQTPNCFCARQTLTNTGINYFCAAATAGSSPQFFQCVPQGTNSTLNCGSGTDCGCAYGKECSCGGRASPCTPRGSQQVCPR